MSDRPRLVLLGDGDWAALALRRLMAAAEPYAVMAVVLRAECSGPALQHAAAEFGIPCFQPVDINAPEFVARLRQARADLGVSIAYNQILRPAARRAYRLGCLNVHAGKLPQYRGRNVLNWALINGESEIGLTVHFMDDGIDTGDIVLQTTLAVGWTDTYGEVLARVVSHVPDLVEEAVSRVIRGCADRRSQAGLVGTYFGGRVPGDEWLDWSDTSIDLHNKIRAIARPAPGARTVLDGRPVTVWRAFCDPSWPKYRAISGQVVARCAGEGVVVKTGDSTLLLREVQFADEKPTIPAWPIGTRLGMSAGAALADVMQRVRALEGVLARDMIDR